MYVLIVHCIPAGVLSRAGWQSYTYRCWMLSFPNSSASVYLITEREIKSFILSGENNENKVSCAEINT